MGVNNFYTLAQWCHLGRDGVPHLKGLYRRRVGVLCILVWNCRARAEQRQIRGNKKRQVFICEEMWDRWEKRWGHFVWPSNVDTVAVISTRHLHQKDMGLKTWAFSTFGYCHFLCFFTFLVWLLSTSGWLKKKRLNLIGLNFWMSIVTVWYFLWHLLSELLLSCFCFFVFCIFLFLRSF